VDDPEHQRARAERGAQRARHIEARGVPVGLLQKPRGGEDRGEAEGDVEEEPVAPGQRLGQHTADDQAEARADAGQRTIGGHRPRPLTSFGEARRQQRQRRRRKRGGTDALHGARRDHPRRRLRQAHGERRRREHGDAEHEGAPPAEQVADARAEQQQAAERERVRVLRPREPGRREPEVGVDPR
jgi:hypothetical protein